MQFDRQARLRLVVLLPIKTFVDLEHSRSEYQRAIELSYMSCFTRCETGFSPLKKRNKLDVSVTEADSRPLPHGVNYTASLAPATRLA